MKKHFVSFLNDIMNFPQFSIPNSPESTYPRVDPLFQKNKGSTKQGAKTCCEVSGLLET